MAFLPIAAAAAPAIFSGIGSLFGNNSAQNAANAATEASTADTEQQTQLDQQLMSQYDTLMQNYDQYYEPLLGATTSTAGGLLNESEPAQYSSFANAEQYLSDPNATLSGAGGTGGYTMQQLYDESQQGLDPAYSQYLQGSLQDQTLQQINELSGMDVPNPTGAAGDIAMKGLDASASLDAQLAAQNQQVKNNALAALQTTAGGIDENTMNNLMQAFGLAVQPSTTATGLINNGTQSLQQGTQGTNQIVGQYAGAAGTAANNAATAKASMTNPFSGLATMFANNPNILSGQVGQPKAAPLG